MMNDNTAAAADDVLGASNAAPPAFICPITMQIMRDPVMTSDGNSCERAVTPNPPQPSTRAQVDG